MADIDLTPEQQSVRNVMWTRLGAMIIEAQQLVGLSIGGSIMLALLLDVAANLMQQAKHPDPEGAFMLEAQKAWRGIIADLNRGKSLNG